MTPEHRAQIEAILGRELDINDLAPRVRLEDISPAQRATAKTIIARGQLVLAAFYLRELAPLRAGSVSRMIAELECG